MGKPIKGAPDTFARGGCEAAAVVCKTRHGNLHAGVLFLDKDEQPRALHLGWQDQLQNQWPCAGLWAGPEAETENLELVAAYCEVVWQTYQADGTFPYALNFNGASFDANGRLHLGPGGRGLTCATFVLAIFKSVGIELVDMEDWPVRLDEDKAFLESIANFVQADHFRVLEDEVAQGAHRVHPPEVLAACEFRGPTRFSGLTASSDAIRNQLTED